MPQLMPQLGATTWTALGLLALLCFWMLGAYNRVMALRMAIVNAWTQAEPLLQSRHRALTALCAAVEQPLASERATLEAVAQAQAQAWSAIEALRARPAAADAALRLGGAETALASALARLLALVEQHDALHTEPGVAWPLRTLRELPPKLQFARQVFNDAAAAYNAAARQFPTRLLAPLFRFTPAGGW